MKHTKEEIKEYYNWIRKQRIEAKKISKNIDEATKEQIAKVQAVIPTMSWIWYLFCKKQMEALWFSWFPWLDCKTYKWRKEHWFLVKKWEKSKIFGITWIPFNNDDWEKGWKYPKIYHLFHTSQVEENK